MSGLSYDDLERMALAFVLEDDTWSVFLGYVADNANSEDARAWSADPPDQAALQNEWLLRSADPSVRALARP